MIDYKSITGDEKKVLDFMLDVLTERMSKDYKGFIKEFGEEFKEDYERISGEEFKEVTLSIPEAREAIIVLVEKGFAKIHVEEALKGLKFWLEPCIPEGLK